MLGCEVPNLGACEARQGCQPELDKFISFDLSSVGPIEVDQSVVRPSLLDATGHHKMKHSMQSGVSPLGAATGKSPRGKEHKVPSGVTTHGAAADKSPRGENIVSPPLHPPVCVGTGWDASPQAPPITDAFNTQPSEPKRYVNCPSAPSHDLLTPASGPSQPAEPLPTRFKVITWNCRTLFGSTQGTPEQVRRVRATHATLRRLSKLADVVLLQESHGTEADLFSLRHVYPDHIVLGSFGVSPSAGGLVFLISMRFAETYGDPILLKKVLRARAVVPGRIAFVTFPASFNLTRLAIFNIHIDPGLPGFDPGYSNAKLRMIHQLFGAVPAKPVTHSILAGDWNIVEADDPRFHPMTNKFTPDTSIHSKILESKLVGYTELHQPAYTRRQIEGKSISVLSRIDRCYSN